jgi:hypothetical protein
MHAYRTPSLAARLPSIALAGLVAILAPLAAAEELSVKQIVQNIDDLYEGDTRTAELVMYLVDNSGRQRVRQLKGFNKVFDEYEASVLYFVAPAEVKNTAYMEFDWKDEEREDDAWLYLPALHKVKRVASTAKSDSFMGSDFTYSDINGPPVWDWKYRIVKDNEKVDGHDCWVMESVPRSEKKQKVLDETGYVKRTTWVRKDSFYIVKGKFFVQKGRKIKYYTVKGLHQVDGVWTPERQEMVTTKKGRVENTTVIEWKNPSYNMPLDDTLFTTQAMERGL